MHLPGSKWCWSSLGTPCRDQLTAQQEPAGGRLPGPSWPAATAVHELADRLHAHADALAALGVELERLERGS